MLAEQAARGRAHGVDVQPLARWQHQVASPAVHQRHTVGAGVERVVIHALEGQETCMEAVVHRFGPLQRDAGRQEGVDAAHPGKRFPRQAGVDVDHLAERMHAGVGAARHRGHHAAAGELLDGVLEPVLHRIAVRLRLPAGEGGAVIVEAEGNAGHGAEIDDKTGASENGAAPTKKRPMAGSQKANAPGATLPAHWWRAAGRTACAQPDILQLACQLTGQAAG